MADWGGGGGGYRLQAADQILIVNKPVRHSFKLLYNITRYIKCGIEWKLGRIMEGAYVFFEIYASRPTFIY